MKKGFTASGAVSLIMIFCVLCMAVFTALTLVTATREQSLSNVTAESAAAYYEADRKATETVAEILRGERPEGVIFTDDGAEFTVPAGGDLLLAVSVELGDECKITEWKTVYAGDWMPEDEITVWSGE